MKHHDSKAPQLAKSPIVKQMPVVCSNELAAVEFLEHTRWGDTLCCVHCGDTDVIKLKDKATGERNKRFLWKCHGCKKQYTVRIGTVYEESRIELRHWCLAFWLMSVSKKGISALQVMRQTGISYKSALFLVHRIRFAMAPTNGTTRRLTGTVECDETYVGPSRHGKRRHAGDPIRKRGRGTTKTPVFAVVQRGGDVRTCVMPNVTGQNIREVLKAHVHPDTRIITDELSVYPKATEGFGGHETVNHASGEYARKDVYTNTAESFFAILKRGLVGTFHAVSKQHLHRYVSEFEFRYNARKMNDGDRTLHAIRSADGKRLYYRQPTDEAA